MGYAQKSNFQKPSANACQPKNIQVLTGKAYGGRVGDRGPPPEGIHIQKKISKRMVPINTQRPEYIRGVFTPSPQKSGPKRGGGGLKIEIFIEG